MDISILPTIMRHTFNVVSGFGQWFTTPIIYNLSPMVILFGAGLGVIITLHVVHLVNPLG